MVTTAARPGDGDGPLATIAAAAEALGLTAAATSGGVTRCASASSCRSSSRTRASTTHVEELREEVAVAEEAGFDAVFLPEFHQARGGALVSPLLVGAALLQGTTRIRFGSAVLATPLHHPVRLAEDAIMLDWITRGRLVLGLGIAHQVPDFKAYGVPRERPDRGVRGGARPARALLRG